MKIETLSIDFTDEQKRYLEGFTSGLQINRAGRDLGSTAAGKGNSEPTGPDAAHIKAQDSMIASGKTLAVNQSTDKAVIDVNNRVAAATCRNPIAAGVLVRPPM